MQGCSADDLRAVRAGDRAFREAADVRQPASGVLLKSPPHTGRIEVLARLFPGAKFIHIVRNPYSLCSLRRCGCGNRSTRCRGCRCPRGKGMDEYVFDCLTRMYRGFEDQRQRLDPAAIYDVRYEDLVADPVGEVGKIYEQLELGDFGPVRDKIAAFVGAAEGLQDQQARAGRGAEGQDSPAVGGVL